MRSRDQAQVFIVECGDLVFGYLHGVLVYGALPWTPSQGDITFDWQAAVLVPSSVAEKSIGASLRRLVFRGKAVVSLPLKFG
jgi:hypothetical protein